MLHRMRWAHDAPNSLSPRRRRPRRPSARRRRRTRTRTRCPNTCSRSTSASSARPCGITLGVRRHRRDAVAVTASARGRGGLRTHRFEDLLKAHTARLDRLKACKAEIVKAPTPKAMTETPLEGARAQRLFCSGSRRWRQTCSVHAGRDDDPQGEDDGGQVSPLRNPSPFRVTMHPC